MTTYKILITAVYKDDALTDPEKLERALNNKVDDAIIMRGMLTEDLPGGPTLDSWYLKIERVP
jgi:hypothetical protein